MTVITLTSCPPALRGDLTLWMQEINTGTYVGVLNHRIRELLWERVLHYIRNGRATMVYSANNEQRMEFRIHNGTWEVCDYDGISLVKRPCCKESHEEKEIQVSKSKRSDDKKDSEIDIRSYRDYVVLDLETTGLKADSNGIIEIGALKIEEGIIKEELHLLVKTDYEIPDVIVKFTGITKDMLQEGVDEKAALEALKLFVGSLPIVAHNLAFDMGFIAETCKRQEIEWVNDSGTDTIKLARKKFPGLKSYKLESLLEHFNISHGRLHRALTDCRAIHALYTKLNENEK